MSPAGKASACAAERPRVLIAGGGVAALEAALALREIAGGSLALTLLSAQPHFEYRPLAVAEPFDLGRAHRFALDELLAGRDIGIVVDALDSVDAAGRTVRTAAGRTMPYNALLLAVGSQAHSAVPGALTFSGSRSSADVRSLLRGAGTGRLRRLAFAVPAGASWSLPAYELALMAGSRFAERGEQVELALVTPEPRPIDVFGDAASAAVAEMLRLRGISFHSATPTRAEPGRLLVDDGEPIAADAVIALPRLLAIRVAGVPLSRDGFVPVDERGRVPRLSRVYAAGDITALSLKQGGLAAQQAQVAAAAIAADLGSGPEPGPFRPRLRGLLLTGHAPRHLRAELISNVPAEAMGETDSWPPEKIAGRRLGPLLARHGAPGGAPPGAVAMELVAPDPPP